MKVKVTKEQYKALVERVYDKQNERRCNHATIEEVQTECNKIMNPNRKIDGFTASGLAYAMRERLGKWCSVQMVKVALTYQNYYKVCAATYNEDGTHNILIPTFEMMHTATEDFVYVAPVPDSEQ